MLRPQHQRHPRDPDNDHPHTPCEPQGRKARNVVRNGTGEGLSEAVERGGKGPRSELEAEEQERNGEKFYRTPQRHSIRAGAMCYKSLKNNE